MLISRNNITKPIRAAIKAAQKTVKVASDVAHKNTVKTQIFVGLNDGDTKEQQFNTERYVSVLKHVCVQYGISFSFDIIKGGYVHFDGEYTEENTIVLTLIDVPRKTIDAIAEDLCVLFRQESVLITSGFIQSRTIHRITD